MTQHETGTALALADPSPLAVICCGGTLPYAVAAAAVARGRNVILFPLRGSADAALAEHYPHHWIALGQFGRFARLAKVAGCHDVVMIGHLVRPALRQIRLDFATLRVLPRLIAGFRGGDNHLLTTVGRIFEEAGFRLLGAHEVAPEILMPEGPLGRATPTARDGPDIARGFAVLAAMSTFDIGQAVVVVDNRILAVEAAEGTDDLLARIAALRRSGRIRSPVGRGVLVKAPKRNQDRRLDLPSIGPKTVEGMTQAGLAGIAVTAGAAIVAEPERMRLLADEASVFIVGVNDDGASG